MHLLRAQRDLGSYRAQITDGMDRAGDERRAVLREPEAPAPAVVRESDASAVEVEAAMQAANEQLEQHRYQLRSDVDARVELVRRPGGTSTLELR